MKIHTLLLICGLLAISVHALPAGERGEANESTQSGDLLSVTVNEVQDMLERYADGGDSNSGSGSAQHKTKDSDSSTAGNISQETIIDDIEAAFEKATQRVEQLVSTAVEELKESFKNFLESFSANEQEDFHGEHKIRKPIDEGEVDEDDYDYGNFDEYSEEDDSNEDSEEGYSSDEDYDSDESNEADDESNEDEYEDDDDNDQYVDEAEEDKYIEPVPSINDVRGNELDESSTKNPQIN